MKVGYEKIEKQPGRNQSRIRENVQVIEQPAAPAPERKGLDLLVDTWKLEATITGIFNLPGYLQLVSDI